jgi:hypothetical protein
MEEKTLEMFSQEQMMNIGANGESSIFIVGSSDHLIQDIHNHNAEFLMKKLDRHTTRCEMDPLITQKMEELVQTGKNAFFAFKDNYIEYDYMNTIFEKIHVFNGNNRNKIVPIFRFFEVYSTRIRQKYMEKEHFIFIYYDMKFSDIMYFLHKKFGKKIENSAVRNLMLQLNDKYNTEFLVFHCFGEEITDIYKYYVDDKRDIPEKCQAGYLMK